MSCRHCIDGKTIFYPDAGSWSPRPPRSEEELRHAEPCECCSVCFGCDEIRELVAEVDEGGLCLECAARLTVFATEAA